MEIFNLVVGCVVCFHVTSALSVLSRCQEKDKCEVNRPKTVPSCYCDKDCFHYMDCCKEYVIDTNADTKTQNISSKRCVLIADQNSVVSERVGTFMIDHCKESNIPCNTMEDLKSLVPVSDTTDVYLNNECALCNGVHEFRYWKAVYSIPNEEGLFKLSRKGLRNAEVLSVLENGRSIHKYDLNFHPPTEFHPRFCPYDIWQDQTRQQKRNIPYQNPILCENKFFFKNIDECIRDGCCTSSRSIWCIEYSVNFNDIREAVRDEVDSIQVIIDFDGNNSKKRSSHRKEQKQQNVIYKNMVVHMISELNVGWNDTTDGFDDCVQGFLLYLKSTDFKLQSLYPTYTTGLSRNGTYVLILHFQSHESLDVEQTAELFNLDFNFTCKDWKKDQMIYGNTKVYGANDVYGYFDQMGKGLYYSQKQVLLKSDAYTIESTTKDGMCQSLVLSLEENHPKQRVLVQCSDEIELKDIKNGAKMIKGTVCLFITITLQITRMMFLVLF